MLVGGFAGECMVCAHTHAWLNSWVGVAEFVLVYKEIHFTNPIIIIFAGIIAAQHRNEGLKYMICGVLWIYSVLKVRFKKRCFVENLGEFFSHLCMFAWYHLFVSDFFLSWQCYSCRGEALKNASKPAKSPTSPSAIRSISGRPMPPLGFNAFADDEAESANRPRSVMSVQNANVSTGSGKRGLVSVGPTSYTKEEIAVLRYGSALWGNKPSRWNSDVWKAKLCFLTTAERKRERESVWVWTHVFKY